MRQDDEGQDKEHEVARRSKAKLKKVKAIRDLIGSSVIGLVSLYIAVVKEEYMIGLAGAFIAFGVLSISQALRAMGKE